MDGTSHPKLIVLDQGEDLLVCDAIDVSDNDELLACLHYPSKELTEQREWRIGNDNICLIPEPLHLVATEVAVTFQIIPLQVVNVYLAISGNVLVQDEYLSVGVRLALVELRRFGFEKRELHSLLIQLALRCIAGGDELLQAQRLEVLCKIFGKVAPLGVIARQQDRLVSKYIGIVVEISLHFRLYIVEHGIEFVLFRSLCIIKRIVCHN